MTLDHESHRAALVAALDNLARTAVQDASEQSLAALQQLAQVRAAVVAAPVPEATVEAQAEG